MTLCLKRRSAALSSTYGAGSHVPLRSQPPRIASAWTCGWTFSNPPTARGVLTATGIGIAAGLTTAWLLTRDMAPDMPRRHHEPSFAERLMPTVAPAVRGTGVVLGVTSVLFCSPPGHLVPASHLELDPVCARGHADSVVVAKPGIVGRGPGPALLTCRKCGGKLTLVAYVTGTVPIRRILDHLGLSPPENERPPPPEIRYVPVDEEGREIEAP